MASPQCTVNGLLTLNGVDVAANSNVTIQLGDLAGVGAWTLRCVGTDDENSGAFIDSNTTIDPITKTATFQAPTTNGAALIFESVVNNGVDANGVVDPSLTTRFGVYVLSAGGLRVAALGETTEGSAAYGWTKKFNDSIRLVGGAIQPATPDATPSTLVSRDGSAASAFATVKTSVVRGESGSLLLDAVGMAGMFFDAAGTGEILCGSGVRVPTIKLTGDVVVVRELPLCWNGRLVAGAITWAPSTVGKPQCLSTNGGAVLFVQLDLPHGVRLDAIRVNLKGAGSSANPLPQFPPTVTLIEEDAATLAQTPIAQLVDPTGVPPSGTPAAYRDTPHDVAPVINGGSGAVIDRTSKRYFLQIEPESGTDSLAGMVVYGVGVTYTRLAESVLGND